MNPDQLVQSPAPSVYSGQLTSLSYLFAQLNLFFLFFWGGVIKYVCLHFDIFSFPWKNTQLCMVNMCKEESDVDELLQEATGSHK